MTKSESGGCSTLIDLSGYNATKVGKCELNSQTCGSFAIWSTVPTQPSNVSTSAEEACCGNEIGSKVPDARSHVPCKEDCIPGYSDRSTDNHNPETGIIFIRDNSTNAINYSTPEIDCFNC